MPTSNLLAPPQLYIKSNPNSDGLWGKTPLIKYMHARNNTFYHAMKKGLILYMYVHYKYLYKKKNLGRRKS